MPRFKSFDGLQLAYEAEGRGFPTILVHGFAQDAFTSWVRPGLSTRLAKAGRRVIALDNRGHGLSAAPHELEAYSGDAVLRDIQALLDTLDVEQCDIVAYSMGASATLRLLPEEPRIRAAVLGGIGASAAGRQRDGSAPEAPQPDAQQAGSGAAEASSGAAARSNPLADAMLVEDKSQISSPIARSFRDYADVTGADRKALAAFIQGVPISRGPAGGVDKVTIPVLVIAGEGDPLAREPERLASMFAKGRCVTVPGTHLNVLNNPQFQQAIADFLAEQG